METKLAPPVVRTAQVTQGAVFMHMGRPLRVDKVTGDDAAAPVILEELTSWGISGAGQYCLWSVDFVTRAMANIQSRMK
jgi:hypothetical protein